jgi:hypothetical protein
MAATMTTYAISAFWHGFYPGYYLFFLISAVYTEIAKGKNKGRLVDISQMQEPFFAQSSSKTRSSRCFMTILECTLPFGS